MRGRRIRQAARCSSMRLQAIWVIFIASIGALGFAGGQPDDVEDSIEPMAPTNWLEHRVSRFVDNREGTVSSRASWSGNTISAHLKRIGTDQSAPAPLRIHIAYQLQDLADQGKVRFLKDKLLPAMTAELARHIKVKEPVAGRLLLARECGRAVKMSDGTLRCVELSPQDYCGSPTLGIRHNLADFFASYELCDEQGRECQTFPGAAGVQDADYVLYVTAKNMECGGGTIGYAAPCELDLATSRPTAGFINFCPRNIEPVPEKFTDQLGTAVHEVIHALGFTSPLFSLYTDADGLARGLDRVLQTIQTDGHREFFISTPTVVEEIRDHFSCPTLYGAKLEDEGFRGTVGSHWDSRWFQGEIMDGATDGTISQNAFSRLTMALLEDTGWYVANWDMAAPLTFGAGKGCDFFKSCRSDGGNNYWCDTRNKGVACTWDLKGIGICDVDDLMNNCATPKPISGHSCFQETLGLLDHVWGNSKGPSARCLQEHGPIVRTLQDRVLTKQLHEQQGADCYSMRCDGDGKLLVSTAGGWLYCPTGSYLDLTGHGYLQGTLGPCPDNGMICAELGCPSQCSGHGRCSNGECRCHLGWAGEICDQVICSSSSEPNSLSCPANSICTPESGLCNWAPGAYVSSRQPEAPPPETSPALADWMLQSEAAQQAEVPPVLSSTTNSDDGNQHERAGTRQNQQAEPPNGVRRPMGNIAVTIVDAQPDDIAQDIGGSTDDFPAEVIEVTTEDVNHSGEADPMMILQTRFSVTSQGALRLSMDRVVMLAETIAALLDVPADSVEISSFDIKESTGFSSWVTSTHAITAKIRTHDVASMAERFLSLDDSGKIVLFEECCRLALVKGSLAIDGYVQVQQNANSAKSATFALEALVIFGGSCIIVLAIVLIVATFAGFQFVLWRQRQKARRGGYTPEALEDTPSTRSGDAASAVAAVAANHPQTGQQYPPPPRSSTGYDGDSELVDSCHQQQLQEMALLRKSSRRDTVLSLGGGCSEVIEDDGRPASADLSSPCPERAFDENADDDGPHYVAGADENSAAYVEHEACPEIPPLLDASVAKLRSEAEL